MKRNMVLRGYEDSASGSEDELVTNTSNRVAKAKNKDFVKGDEKVAHVARQLLRNKAKVYKDNTGRIIHSNYSIKPIEQSVKKKSRRDDSSDDGGAVSTSESDEGDFTPQKRKIKTGSKLTNKKSKKEMAKGNNVLYEYSFNTIFVIDYDLTLVDRHAHPFPGAKKFIQDLYHFNDGRSTLVLYSHASSGHVERGFSTHFAQEADMFTEMITDHTMSKNKPVTQVRRVLSSIADLSGPFVIIDDARSNLDDDQYDITIDVSRHFIRDKSTNQVIGIDYVKIWCLLNEGIKNWLKTKRKQVSVNNTKK